MLWLALDTDFQSALWQVARLDIHEIGGTVRVDKVALCLGWGCVIVALTRYRYRITMPSVIGSISGIWLIQFAFVTCEVAIYGLPSAGALIVEHIWIAVIAIIALWLAPQLISMVWVYFMLTRAGLEDKHSRLVFAIALGASAMMMSVSLFDIVHPGVAWRKSW